MAMMQLTLVSNSSENGKGYNKEKESRGNIISLHKINLFVPYLSISQDY